MAKRKGKKRAKKGVAVREQTAKRRKRIRSYDGNRQCQRCRKRTAEFRVIIEGDTRFLCSMCKDVVEDKPPEIMIHDHSRSVYTKEVEAFIQRKMDPLRQAILESPLRTLYVALRGSNMRVGTVVVKHSIQARPAEAPKGWRPWMSVDVSVRRTHQYPFTDTLATSSMEVESEVDRELMGKDWFFEHEEVVFNDPAEVFIYGAGYGLFKILRTLKLVPGRASKVGMRANGLVWLREFREARPHLADNPPEMATLQVAS